MIDQQTKYDKNISLDEVLTLWHNMYGEDMEQEYGSFIEALSNSGSGQDKITEEMSEQYANWILTECSTPVDEIQYLVSEILSSRNEEEKKRHLTESINEVIQWINE